MTDNRILDYIRSSQNLGQTTEQIWSSLLTSGFAVPDIQDAFAILQSDKTQSSVSVANTPVEEAVPSVPESLEKTAPVVEEVKKENVVKREVSDPEAHHARTVSVVVTIGVILIAAGVFTFIAGNWQYIPKFMKLLIILASMLASYGGAFVADNYGYSSTSRALYLLGALIYGGAIFLVAQMFQIRALWPDGFLLWMIGVVPLAWALGYGELFLLSVILGFIAIFGYPYEIVYTWIGSNKFLMTSSFLTFVSAGVAFWGGLVSKSRLPEDVKSKY